MEQKKKGAVRPGVVSKPNVLIVGAGAVAHVAAHKAAQHNDVLGNICIASRKVAKANAIIDSIKRKKSAKDKKARIYVRVWTR